MHYFKHRYPSVPCSCRCDTPFSCSTNSMSLEAGVHCPEHVGHQSLGGQSRGTGLLSPALEPETEVMPCALSPAGLHADLGNVCSFHKPRNHGQDKGRGIFSTKLESNPTPFGSF